MPKKVCIFCQESRKLSKEHFWPEWFRAYVDTSESDRYSNSVLEGEAKSTTKDVEKFIERNENLITLKFRVVCGVCNSGWMSQLETQVKEFFVAVNSGKKPSIDSELQYLLARWVVMKVMVAEQSEDGTQVTPPKDMKSFYESGQIPDYFRVYIGKHEVESKSAYMRHTNTVALSREGPLEPMCGLERNTQTIAFIFGPVFIYVVACRERESKIWRNLKLNELVSIYPMKKKKIEWKSVKVTRQKRLADIAHALSDFVSSDKVLYGGKLSHEKDL